MSARSIFIIGLTIGVFVGVVGHYYYIKKIIVDARRDRANHETIKEAASGFERDLSRLSEERILLREYAIRVQRYLDKKDYDGLRSRNAEFIKEIGD